MREDGVQLGVARLVAVVLRVVVREDRVQLGIARLVAVVIRRARQRDRDRSDRESDGKLLEKTLQDVLRFVRDRPMRPMGRASQRPVSRRSRCAQRQSRSSHFVVKRALGPTAERGAY